ncbi:L-glutamate gamma-semialdehyde dehydrogenase [Luteitalea sp.]|uniref:L-glutamate gamma-semialdehyde dehydrogenase n=1 Tax=Luteitalea sp. TaxID=2004800 RepID=UPI000AAA4634|nr:L-glutamate gamma-semialdehyde dehydrogenase [Luteitalea sp.]
MSDSSVASLGARRRVPVAVNEPIRSYAPGTPERAALKARLASMAGEHADIPVIVNGKEYRTGDTAPVVMPHAHQQVLGTWHKATPDLVQQAIEASAAARIEWSRWAWEDRAAVFLRAAELLSTTWRDTLNAATMLGQSKTAFQSEIDAACELIDFFRFNCAYAQDLYGEQPISEKGVWNQTDYRPLEGFIYAVSPFNFTAIGGNLSGAPALVGNTVIWKPAQTAMLSAYYVMKLLEAAGLPPGVINFVPGDPVPISDALLAHPDLGGVHFTGSTTVFNSMWKTIGGRMGQYRSYPRIVGETGGKDFIMAHASADVDALAVAIVRGSFEYQGQKCSACSRVYIPQSLWPGVKERMVAMMATIQMGDVRDFRNFMGAVIDEKSFTKISGYLDEARRSGTIVSGGTASKDVGYFVAPTLVQVEDPGSRLLCEEIFGPLVTAYVYPDNQYVETMQIVDRTSPYALTGAIFADDRHAVRLAHTHLRNAAGNFYINDKCTGAVVGQQPFGGARGSGTNDKAGSKLNLQRWVSPRSIKETFVPPTDYRYPFMGDE